MDLNRNTMQKRAIALLVIFLIVFIHKGLAQEQETNDAGFIKIFNGENLQGWDGDTTYWRVETGILIGEVTAATILKRNSFIIWKEKQPGDFELLVDYRVSAHGNSGINYRSALLNSLPFALKGYQADIDGEDNWSGQNYEERGREFLALRGQKVIIGNAEKPLVIGSLGSKNSLQTFIKKEEWNKCRLVVKNNRMQHYINNVLMSDVTDNDETNRTNKGYVGVQVHVGPLMKIEYRNFMFKEL